MCSRHFSGGDASCAPSVHISRQKFCFPEKQGPRAKHVKARNVLREVSELSKSTTPAPASSSRSVTPVAPITPFSSEQLESDYSVHKLQMYSMYQ